MRFFLIFGILCGCASRTVVDREPWLAAAAAHLRAQLDRDHEAIAVEGGLLTRFYLKRDDRPAWCGPTGPRSQADALLLMLKQAADDGLTPTDYALERIESELERWRRAGPRPGMSSRALLSVAAFRRRRWYVTAKRWASSRRRCR